MSDRSRKWIFQITSLLMAGGLLYLALRGVDLNRVGTDMTNGKYVWVFPLIFITVLSHVIRAWRWTLLLEVLPEEAQVLKKISILAAFKSLMVGYMTNYAAPRLGEVVRTGHLSLRTGLTFGGIFGTVVAERILDVVSLVLGLISVPFLLQTSVGRLFKKLAADGSSASELLPVLYAVSALLAVVLIAVIIYVRYKNKGGGHRSKLAAWVDSFRAGMTTILRTRRPVQLVFSTLLMWGCYGLMSYLPFFIFGMSDQFGLGFSDAWSLMLLGAIGVLIPSPGGIGSYHYIAITSLVTIWGVTQTTAASYAIFTHGGQLILYVAIGFVVLILDGSSWNELKIVGSSTRE